jgi:hypothetical protein
MVTLSPSGARMPPSPGYSGAPTEHPMRASTCLLFTSLLASASPALAARQALEVRATATAVGPAGGPAVAVGDVITVTLTLDTDWSDGDPSPTFGLYTFAGVGFDVGIRAPNQWWSQDTAGDTEWEIIDRPAGQPDELRVSAGMLSGSGLYGANDGSATLVFVDPSGTALTSDALMLPTLAAFPVVSLEIAGYGGAWQVDADVDATRAIPYIDIVFPGGGPPWIDGAGFTPNGMIALVRSELLGFAVVPTGPCAGADVRLDVPELVLTVRANRRGGIRFPITLGYFYDGYVAVDLATCVASVVGDVN